MYVLSIYCHSLSFTVIPSLFHVQYIIIILSPRSQLISTQSTKGIHTCTCVIITVIAQRKHTVVIFHQ